jgi:nicotinamidase-related amidase
MSENAVLSLRLSRRVLGFDLRGRSLWRMKPFAAQWPVDETALLICDMWDSHWSRGAAERVDVMAPQVDRVVKAVRERGVAIIHAPSDTMDFYFKDPARRRIQMIRRVRPPRIEPKVDPPLPIDDSDGGSDTGETPWFKAWSRQHAAIEIDQDRDVISDDGTEIWSFMQLRGIKNLLILGVHTNMCVLGRSFGIRRMVAYGVNVALVRDLTDTMYNPARSPYVNHEVGTRLVIEYIEKFCCPSLDSIQLIQ